MATAAAPARTSEMHVMATSRSCYSAPCPRAAAAACRRQAPRRRRCAAAAAAPQPQQPHIPEVLPVEEAAGAPPEPHAVPDLVADQQLWHEVEAAATAAEQLENSGRGEEAIDVLKQALARLEAAGGDDFALVPLLQLLWDALHSAGRHREALLAMARVNAAVGARFGADSAEVQLVSVRLGISTAACGQMEAGLKLIYEATPVLQHNLTSWIDRANAAAAAPGGLDVQEAAVMQEGIDKLATALGEGNFYGALLTMRHAAALDVQQSVVQGWQELEAIAVGGFCTLLSAAGGAAAAGSVAAALREHDRLVGDLVDDPLLARLVHAQNAWLHEIAAAGLAHPIFEQQEEGGDYSP